VRTPLALVLAAACSGTAGVRDHSEALVAATHCRDHACPTTPQARGIGEGCYVVGDQLYQCSTDLLPAGEAWCFEVPRCSGACTAAITDSSGDEISTEHCRDRWRADRKSHRPPPTCSPVQLVIAIGSAAAPSPSALALPEALVVEVIRSGKVRVVYEADACATNDGVVVGEATRTTGFAELDRVLRGKLAELALPPGECLKVALVVWHFECETEQTLD